MSRVTDPFWKKHLGDRIDSQGRYKAVIVGERGAYGVAQVSNKDCCLSDTFKTKSQAIKWAKENDYVLVPMSEAKAWDRGERT